MTIKDFYDRLDSFNNEERRKYVIALFKMLTEFSMMEMQDFQDDWDPSKSFEEFRLAQNIVIRRCIQYELDCFGEAGRAYLKLPHLTWDTMILD